MNLNKKKICMVGSKLAGKEKEENTITLFIRAAEKLGIELTNIRKGAVKARLLANKFEFYSDDLILEEQDAFIFRDTVGLIDPVTKERTRIFPEMVLFAKYLHNQLGKVVFDKYLLSEDPANTKFKNTILLSDAGLPNIPTWLFMTKSEVINHIDDLPYPMIVKPSNGSQGKGVMIFYTKEEFRNFLNKEYLSQIFYPNLIQKAIENDGDYRVLVLGDRVITTVRKRRSENSVVANMSQGNEAEVVEADEELKNLAVKSAQILGMELAGVDIIEDKNTGERYILEVNMSPQIYYTSQFTGRNLAEDILEYVVQKGALGD